MSKKLYRLKKDLPDCPAGREIYYDDNAKEHYSVTRGGSKIYFQDRTVEDNPDWFEEVISEPKKERIEVSVDGRFDFCGFDQTDYHFRVHKGYRLTEDKFPAIKAAIEAIINNDNLTLDFTTPHDYLKEYTQEQVDKIRRDSFFAARHGISISSDNSDRLAARSTFTTFDDYLKTLNP